MNEQQARERAEELAKRNAYSAEPDLRELFEDMYYVGYMQAWRDAQ